MKVRIIDGLCEGHGQCVPAAPEVFALDDDDEEVRVLVEELPIALDAKVKRAGLLCPTRAIVVEP